MVRRADGRTGDPNSDEKKPPAVGGWLVGFCKSSLPACGGGEYSSGEGILVSEVAGEALAAGSSPGAGCGVRS